MNDMDKELKNLVYASSLKAMININNLVCDYECLSQGNLSCEDKIELMDLLLVSIKRWSNFSHAIKEVIEETRE